MSILAILFSLILGIVFIYTARKRKRDDELVSSWPTTSGKILKSEVKCGSVSWSCKLLVEYEFFSNGTRHQSNFIYRSNPNFSLRANYNLNELDFLKNPQVKYNPQNPTDSCLLRNASLRLDLILYILGGFLSLGGLIGIIREFL
jgi:Protein of unknown function (DUF3592)